MYIQSLYKLYQTFINNLIREFSWLIYIESNNQIEKDGFLFIV